MFSLTKKDLPNSQLELTGEIEAGSFKLWREPALKDLGSKTNLKGFRPGHVPAEVLAKRWGEGTILETMAELALQEEYPRMLEQEKIDAIGRPQITITKLALDNPLGFKIVTDIMPAVTLPDWQKIVSKVGPDKEKIEVTEEQIKTIIDDLLASRRTDSEKPLPELTDELAASFGEFKTAQELKERVKTNLQQEGERRAKDKWRISLMDALIKEVKVDLPRTLIEAELDKMLAELQGSIENAGLSFTDYLTHLKKTPEELRAAWQDDAIKRVKIGLTMNKLAEVEKIQPEESEVSHELAHLKSHYPDVPEEKLLAYIAHVVVMEKVWALLEKTATKS